MDVEPLVVDRGFDVVEEPTPELSPLGDVAFRLDVFVLDAERRRPIRRSDDGGALRLADPRRR
jgi:hypothetical protein